MGFKDKYKKGNISDGKMKRKYSDRENEKKIKENDKNMDVEKLLLEDVKSTEIPNSIKPEAMRQKLEQHVVKQENMQQEYSEQEVLRQEILKHESEKQESLQSDIIKEKYIEETHVKTDMETQQMEKQLPAMKKKKRLTYSKALAAAASICVVIGCAVMASRIGLFKDDTNCRYPAYDGVNDQVDTVTKNLTGETENANLTDSSILTGEQLTYEKIYASMSEVWEEEELRRSEFSTGSKSSDFDIADGVVVEEIEDAAEDAVVEYGAESSLLESANSAAMDMSDSAFTDGTYGSTNVQTAGVDEGDIVKNDGRYLYQIVEIEYGKQSIQIVDTKDGLKEVANLEGFQSISEFYIWEDLLIVIENKYLESTIEELSRSYIACYDVLYQDNCYHQISIFDISKRNTPKEVKVFTLQGTYMSSRIADGYFYGFSRYYANPGEGIDDYDAYIPTLDGARLEAENIVLPQDSQGTSYLVMVSIDLANPSDFAETLGIVSDSDQYYVSSDNIYVTYGEYDIEKEEGWSSDQTVILRFAYEEGSIELEAEGCIDGYLNDTFSMDEYEKYLRVVTTVQEYNREYIRDDRTNEVIGMGIVDSRQTNALYVLDDNLNVVGSIEGLAEDEQIYSARFMGNTGYFVTFRQTDPLFAVDLTNPTNPTILSELKVSGFSEYLHFYGENRLFGLGMEADEETGWQDGIKLSMFDISDPGNVQEITRLHMSEYYYSEALYNHRAILIHPTANIIGFSVEGSSSDGYVQEYLVFSYENDTFVQKLKLNTKADDEGYYTSRGTFIGDTFYLLKNNGSVESYDLNTGAQLEVLEY